MSIPSAPATTPPKDEASEAIENADAILTAAQGLLDQLGLF